MMTILVSDEARRATIRCPHNFDCLNSEGYPICPGKKLIGNILFVEAVGKLSDPYKVPFCAGHICTCPMRIEFYKRYGV
jgi:hypothetical protein